MQAPPQPTPKKFRKARRLADLETATRPAVEAFWKAGNSEPQRLPFYTAIARRFLELGEPLTAYDVVRRALGEDQRPQRPLFDDEPSIITLRQWKALALARSGAHERARLVLEGVQLDGHGQGILARLDKDIWLRERSSETLEKAILSYRRAFQAKESNWIGINLATLLKVGGKHQEARERAQWTFDNTLSELKRLEELEKKQRKKARRFWPLLTAAEAYLVLEKAEQAMQRYREAAEVGRERWGDLNSARANAELLVEQAGVDPEDLRKWLAIPNIAIFAGHMIDHQQRRAPRFPDRLAERVAKEIEALLRKFDVGVGYSSAACGSDILFLESLDGLSQHRHVEMHVVLPFRADEFREVSVRQVGGPPWVKRFDSIIERADRLEAASLQRIEGPGVAYDYSNQLALGLASMHSTLLRSNLKSIAVWNGKGGDGPGGTADIIDTWRKFGLKPEIIDLSQMLREEPIVTSGRGRAGQSTTNAKPPLRASIKAMLFADVKGFSQLTESELPKFCEDFMGLVARVISDAGEAVRVKNTWGDGLFIVFESVLAAGRFALDLCDKIHATDWIQKGFSNPLDLRIALHAGPVYECEDPIRDGQRNFIGTHVSRAARMEPVTPQGEVYASEAFAALATVAKVTEFSCDYVGEIALAKSYGSFPTYHVRRPLKTRK